MSALPRLSVQMGYSSLLQQSYMPFVEKGGVFVATRHPFAFGDEVMLNLQLPSDPDPLLVQARVVWITPEHAENGFPTGVGFQFIGNQADLAHTRIETLTAGVAMGERSFTM